MLIVDDLLDSQFAEGLYTHIMYNSMHKYGHSSAGGSKFYTVEFKKEDPLIQKVLKQVLIHTNGSLKRVYANIQYAGMDGDWHYDDGDTTCLIFLSKDIEGGDFQIKDPYTSIEPNFNRLVVFNGSKTPHRGLAPLNQGIARVSLALKLWE